MWTSLAVAMFVIGGAVLIWLGFNAYNETCAFTEGALKADGVVVDFEIWDPPGADISEEIWYAMVRYTPEGGEELTFTGPSRNGLVNLDKGDAVTVLYHPEDPAGARVDSFMGLWFKAAIMWLVGAGAIFVPLLTLREAYKWAKAQAR